LQKNVLAKIKICKINFGYYYVERNHQSWPITIHFKLQNGLPNFILSFLIADLSKKNSSTTYVLHELSTDTHKISATIQQLCTPL
jgi:hypothetical protein